MLLIIDHVNILHFIVPLFIKRPWLMKKAVYQQDLISTFIRKMLDAEKMRLKT